MKSVAEEIKSSFGYLAERFKVEINTDEIPSSLRTGPMFDAELFSVLVNLISNALKAVIAARGNSVKIQARKDDVGTVIRVFDDGIGISHDIRDSLFQPLVVDPEGRLYKGLRDMIPDDELLVLGLGSGLGLTIVKGILESYGKSASFIDAKKPWKTCIEAVLP